MHFLLLHFNSLFGPEVFLSLPDDIPGNLSNKIQKIFDLEVLDNFFEITIKKENIKITNMYLELSSQWARGGVEMIMLSVLTGEEVDNTLFHDILNEYAHKLKNIPNISKSFYESDKVHSDDNEIKIKKEELREILLECYNHLKTTTKPDYDGKPIIKKFKQLHW